MYDVKGSRAIITGSAQGLGKEYAERLLQNGCKVCLSDIDEVKGLETKMQFQKQFQLKDDGVCFVKCDITKKDDWSELWELAEKSLKGPIDILINNAGLSASWDKMLDIMVMGHVRGVFMAIEKMGRSHGGRGGRIINTASAAGLTDRPPLGDLNTTTYAVAKHAMVSMTRSFLTSDPPVYESEGIKCYALCPGFVETNLVQKALADKGMTNQDLTQRTNMRVMTTKEIGDALVKSLQYDKDGAIYCILPDMPLIEMPDDEQGRLMSIILANKLIGSRLNLELFTGKHYYVFLLFGSYLMYYILTTLLCWIHCLLFD